MYIDIDLFEQSLMIVTIIYFCCVIIYKLKTGISDNTKSTIKFCITFLSLLVGFFIIPTTVVYLILKYIIY